LTAIDLGNTENIKNRNRLYNEGLESIVQGIYQTKTASIISELHLQSTCLSGEGLQIMRALKSEKFDLQVLNLANNDLEDCSAFYLRHLMDGLVSLNLCNTKLGSKGCLELAKNIKLPCKESTEKSRLQ
jgi:hypothetical protein